MLLGLFLFVVYPTVEVLPYINNQYLFALMIVFRLALFFVLFHALGYWFYRLIPNKRQFATPSAIKKRNHPYVAILIPIRNEPPELIMRMFDSLKKIKYPKANIVIIDNSTTAKTHYFYIMSKKIDLPISIVRKKDTKGFKAGALNKALSTLKEEIEYVLVLDVDHAPQPDILDRLIPILIRDTSAAFVQAPQRYYENGNSLIKEAFCYKQRIFYDHICSGLAGNGVLFFSGTNALFRKEALFEIGGFDESSLTEDLRSSVKLHEKKWRGIYYPKCVAFGIPPSDLDTYFKQQRRWAIGTYQNLFFGLEQVVKGQSDLSLSQKMLYLGWNGTYYFQGFVSVVLIICSIIFLFLSNHIQYYWTDMVAFPVFLFTLLSTIGHERKTTNARWTRIFAYKSILFGDALIHMCAFVDFIFSRNLSFEVTNKEIKQKATISTNIINWFFAYHIFLAFIIGFAILLSIFSDSFSLSMVVWPTIFFAQTISIPLLFRKEYKKIKLIYD